MEFLAFGFGRNNQLVPDLTGREAMLRLRVDRTPQAARPVERVARQIVAVRRAEQRGANSSAPCRLRAAQLGPHAARGEPVAGIVERIGVLEGDGIVAV